MARSVATVHTKDLTQNITLHVEIVGQFYGWLEWRRRVACALLRLAARVLQMGIEIKP